MGYRVVTKRFLNEAKTICLFEIEAPLIARHAMAGQFVIFRLDEQGERVPVSVAGYDREKGTVSVMVQAAGRTTKMLHTVEEGDIITDIVGPLGKATEMEGLKKVCVVGGGVGCAIAYPIAKEMHEKGIEVTFIGGFRSADIVILKEELAAASDKLVICTDDGTYGRKGFTTDALRGCAVAAVLSSAGRQSLPALTALTLMPTRWISILSLNAPHFIKKSRMLLHSTSAE